LWSLQSAESLPNGKKRCTYMRTADGCTDFSNQPLSEFYPDDCVIVANGRVAKKIKDVPSSSPCPDSSQVQESEFEPTRVTGTYTVNN
jgi:hypothetical protein